MSDADERQERFDALRQQTGQLLGLSPDHPIVARRAADQLIYEATYTAYIDTGHVDLTAYVRLSELNERNMPAPPPRDVKVEVEIVERRGQENEVRYAYGQKPSSESADGAEPSTTEAKPETLCARRLAAFIAANSTEA